MPSVTMHKRQVKCILEFNITNIMYYKRDTLHITLHYEEVSDTAKSKSAMTARF
jgi:trehalose-6-phosphatase